jgi:endonuclease YncB( thermonuclease family)
MQKSRLWLIGLAALAAIGVWAFAATVREPPAQAVAPVSPLPPPAPAVSQEAAPAPAALAALAPAAAPAAILSDLPTVEVAPRIVHTVPEDGAEPIPRVTLRARDGELIKPRDAAPAAQPAAAAASIMPFSGPAQAAGPATLTVAGRPVRLFGVKPVPPGDRCALGPGDARSCADVARDALAQRLQRRSNVSCRVPAGQRAGDPAAICLDANGVDLGGFLVAEGLALADTSQSYDYFGSQGVARSFRRGLWRYR